VIADTTFLIDFFREGRAARRGPARSFFAEHRTELIRTSVISLGEIAPSFATSAEAWQYFRPWKIYRLHPGVVDAAADVDRRLVQLGWRLGENDNWIAGFCRYYREPLISRDADFDRIQGLRRVAY